MSHFYFFTVIVKKSQTWYKDFYFTGTFLQLFDIQLAPELMCYDRFRQYVWGRYFFYILIFVTCYVV